MRKPSRTWFKQHTYAKSLSISGNCNLAHSVRLRRSYPSFAAPEILRGKTSLLGLDSWSVGVLLFVLAKANFPFSGEVRTHALCACAQ